MRVLRTALLACGLAMCVACGQPAAGPTVVYVVRHAEKAADAQDPPLTPAGVLRAEALTRTLEGAGISAIYSSATRRTEDTARPLAERLGLPISHGTASLDDPASYAKALAGEVLAKHRGQTVLIVNHSNTIPVIVETLGGKPVAPLTDFEYATLFIVTVPASGPATVVRAQYGQPDGAQPAADAAPVSAQAPAVTAGSAVAAAGGRK